MKRGMMMRIACLKTRDSVLLFLTKIAKKRKVMSGLREQLQWNK